MTHPATDPAAALVSIRARMDIAARAAGRKPSSVTLIAACKQQPWAPIAVLIDAGQLMFGESRIQEATRRWADKPAGVELRFIGALQSNKAREAADLFDVIETLDRVSLARSLAEAIQRAGRTPRLGIQVNTGEEPQKAGMVPGQVDGFLIACRRDFDLGIDGLMCIPPLGEPPAPHFALLAAIARRNGLSRLSMGMSGDFETAIRFGATSVRIGSALFGGRSPAVATAPITAPR